jgi:hypothetical protein
MSRQRDAVASSAGKKASIRSSWAVTSIGRPMVDTTEKNANSSPPTAKRRSITGTGRRDVGRSQQLTEAGSLSEAIAISPVPPSNTPPTASHRARSRSAGATTAPWRRLRRTGPASITGAEEGGSVTPGRDPDSRSTPPGRGGRRRSPASGHRRATPRACRGSTPSPAPPRPRWYRRRGGGRT